MLLLCLAAGQRTGLGNTIKLKIAQSEKLLKEHPLQIRVQVVQASSAAPLLKSDEGSRLCIKLYVEGSSYQNHMLVMIWVTLCRSLKIVSNVSLHSNRFGALFLSEAGVKFEHRRGKWQFYTSHIWAD